MRDVGRLRSLRVTGPEATQSDNDLVESCNSGDREAAQRAFAALYRRHKDFVLRAALNIVHDNALALDAMQETFAYVLRQFPPTGPGLTLRAKMTTYLYPIARNSAITQWRKASRAAADVPPDALPMPEPVSDSDVYAVLLELPFARREVLTLRYLHDLTLGDIASALDIPLGTVKSRLHAGIEQLRNSPKVRSFFEK